jgi:hypothetical protein
MGSVHPSPEAGSSRRGARFAVCAALASVALLATACQATTIELPIGSGSSCGSWRTVPSPSVGSGFNTLDGVTVVPGGGAWAVGAYRDASGVGRSLALRYQDGAWQQVKTPPIGEEGTFLNDVEALSPIDAWAVGATRNSDGIARTFAMHWNGGAWGAVPTPNFGSGDNFLTDVAIVGRNDVWAAGYRHFGTSTKSLLLHWSGGAWRSVPFEIKGSVADGLNAISAEPNGDLWAVGGFSNANTSTQTLILHFNGERWRSEPSPNVSVHGNSLTGVVGSGADAWAVGGFRDFQGDRPLFLTADQGSWRLHRMPDSRAVSDDLNDVTAVAPNDLYAVGSTFDGHIDHPLIMRGNGTTWYRMPTSDAGVEGSRLSAVAASPSGDVWAVGTYSGARPGRTLIQHFCPATG